MLCPKCGGAMKIIAFITETGVMKAIPGHLDEPTSPPRLRTARGPPLWEMAGALPDKSDPQAQPAPDDEFDQRIAWWGKRRTDVARRGLLVPLATRAANFRRPGGHMHRQRECRGGFFRGGQEKSARSSRFTQTGTGEIL